MFGEKHLNFERALNRCGHTAHYKEMTETAETAHKKSLASRLATQKMCSKSPIYSYWLSPISLCLYRIRSFIVVGHKLFYVSFKNATIDFMIIIVKTLFLYNITRMPYFVASDELTLATFVFEPETFLR